MKKELIKSAQIVLAPREFAAPVIMRRLVLEKPSCGEIALSAYGFFILYVNGRRVGEDYFIPSASLYRRREFKSLAYPISDEFTYRLYYNTYDISEYLTDGDNTIEIALGDGWYRQTERVAEGDMSFGNALGTIYAVRVHDAHGERNFVSDGSELCRTGSVVYSQLFYGEVRDYRIDRDRAYRYAAPTATGVYGAELSPTIAPTDRIIRRIKPKLISERGSRRIYDVGENISGFAVVRARAPEDVRIVLRFAECISGGELDFGSTGSSYKSPGGKSQIQEDSFIGDGEEHIFAPQFVWHAFRYIEVTGEIAEISAAVVHSDIAVTARFLSSSDELNWLFDAFLRTQLDNMHCGFPSDCPHRERLGYTGDGQVCAQGAMLTLASKDFYRKWIQDIFDSQDIKSGHVNHTAPFAGGGGGPGGWGMAAVNVPYFYYKIYADTALLRRHYGGMRKWIDYIISRSDGGLIVREEEGGWCLGDWCTPDKTKIPEPFVNTCLFIKSLDYMKEMSAALGQAADVERWSALQSASRTAVCAAYADDNGSFCGGVQGADAYAVYAGIGDRQTLANLIEKYEALGHFDTGFLGTDVLVRVLFENDAQELAVKLMSSSELGGFGYMMKNGATTLWESWRGDGSLNHPMFGACTAALFWGILGIGQESAGFKKPVIAPKIPDRLNYAEGGIDTPRGRISVCWRKVNSGVEFEITLPEGGAEFEYRGVKRTLTETNNKFFEVS